MFRLIFVLLSIILSVLVSFLVYEPLQVDVKVCTTDWGNDCEQLQVVYGQSLYVYMQSNKPTEISIGVGDELIIVSIDGIEQYELLYDTIKDNDMIQVNGVDFYYEVYDTEVTPEYYFVWDTEADQ